MRWLSAKEAVLCTAESRRPSSNIWKKTYVKIIFNSAHTQTSFFQVAASVINALNNNLLTTLNKEWADHQVAMAMIRDILMYLDRIYVESNDMDNIFNMGLVLFREKVFNAKLI